MSIEDGAEVTALPETDAEGRAPGQRNYDLTPPPRLVQFMSEKWAPPVELPSDPHPGTDHMRTRREQLSGAFPGRNLVIPSGVPSVRSNDTEYPFRPGTDFFYLTGHDEPRCVLVMRATDGGHEATLYLEPRADRSTPAFFTDALRGELWVGPRHGLAETAQRLGIDCAPLDTLQDDLSKLADTPNLVLRDVDASVDAQLPPAEDDASLATALSEMRLVKDAFEVRQMELAVAATIRGFEDVVRALPDAMERGERVIDGVFHLRARVEGNDTGYNTIAASGAHATILHWQRNDGEVRPGELLLLDAGVETKQLYTADVTRTLPVSGRFTPQQRELYELVLRAQEAGIAAVRPGADFLDPHRAAMRVLVQALLDMGLLTGSLDDVLDQEQQRYRRYTRHGTSHMLGMDVHDCSRARDEHYRHGTLQAGMVLTVEPGLYFQPDDLTVPEHLRGIGIRIEDDVLVTEDGCRVLSATLPRHPDDIERWMARLSDEDPQLRRPL
ncbi:MAG TPA: aminopeptidase P family protein [Candidatus Dormibacteraeota bacterium]|nr:aminopeptidase P family protein [Candidatus Dormibacteraeota bacterium]